MAEKLKPCPHCGGPAQNGEVGGSALDWYVECADDCPRYGPEDWNLRAMPDCVRELLDWSFAEVSHIEAEGFHIGAEALLKKIGDVRAYYGEDTNG